MIRRVHATAYLIVLLVSWFTFVLCQPQQISPLEHFDSLAMAFEDSFQTLKSSPDRHTAALFSVQFTTLVFCAILIFAFAAILFLLRITRRNIRETRGTIKQMTDDACEILAKAKDSLDQSKQKIDKLRMNMIDQAWRQARAFVTAFEEFLPEKNRLDLDPLQLSAVLQPLKP
jgi:hypothetical protein